MNDFGRTMACKACGQNFEIHRESLRIYPNGGSSKNPLGLTSIAICKSCNFGQAVPAPTQADLDRYYSSGQYWEEHKENKLLEAHQKVQAAIRLNAIRNFLPVGRKVRVLDVGAGLGFLGDEFCRIARDVEYCAVDPDVPTAKRAIDRLGKTGLASRFLNSIEEAGGGFDFIFLNQVLEHVTDPILLLTNVKSRLAADGVLYVEVPHRDDRFKPDVFPHVLFFSVEALSTAAQRAGLSVQSCEAFGRSGEEKRFGISRISRAILGRVFNFAAKHGLYAVYSWADRALYQYSMRSDGIWIRAVSRK